MPDRPLTATELTAMFEATDNAELARQEQALKAEQTDRPAEAQSPEARDAIAKLRALRDSVGYPMASGAMVLLAEIERLETVIARQAAELDTLRGDNAWPRRANDAFEATFGINKERGA